MKDIVHISKVVKIVMMDIYKRTIRNSLEKDIKGERYNDKESVVATKFRS